MAAKEGRPIFFQALSIVIIVIIINVAYLVYKSGGLPTGLTGFSIKTNISNSFISLSSLGQVILISEISFLFLILLIAFVRDLGLYKSRTKLLEVHIKKNTEENKTDLDTLYDALKEKKELNLSTIAKAFEIDKDTVLEWAKILESADLATIEYPGFSEPVLKYNEKDIKIIEIKKTDVIKDGLKIKKEIEDKVQKKENDKIEKNESSKPKKIKINKKIKKLKKKKIKKKR